MLCPAKHGLPDEFLASNDELIGYDQLEEQVALETQETFGLREVQREMYKILFVSVNTYLADTIKVVLDIMLDGLAECSEGQHIGHLECRAARS